MLHVAAVWAAGPGVHLPVWGEEAGRGWLAMNSGEIRVSCSFPCRYQLPKCHQSALGLFPGNMWNGNV